MEIHELIINMHIESAMNFYGLDEDTTLNTLESFFQGVVELNDKNTLADKIILFKKDLNDDSIWTTFNPSLIASLSEEHYNSKLRMEVEKTISKIYDWLAKAWCKIEKSRVREAIYAIFCY